VPNKVDLPGLVQQISNANQLVHRGNITPLATLSNLSSTFGSNPQSLASQALSNQMQSNDVNQNIGDPSTFPVVFVSEGGDAMVLMSIEGITCAHCIKIVETVLKGCDGTKSPINGLLDATADQALKFLILRIDATVHAKRITYEAARNLSMVGYTTKTLEINLLELKKDSSTIDTQMISTAFEVVGSADPSKIFDWERICRCSPLAVEKEVCPRHNQMNQSILTSFDKRKEQTMLFMNNCASNENTNNAVTMPAPAEQPQPSSNTGGGERMSLFRRNSRLRQSVTSEAGFGRAMSGLSALSIDWENMEDFDVNIDHSSHINNTNLSEPIAKKTYTPETKNEEDNVTPAVVNGMQSGCAMIHDKAAGAQDNILRSFPKRPSILRKPNPVETSSAVENGASGNSNSSVSFKT